MAKRILKRPYAELLPLLSTEEFEALKADLLANGQREAVVIDHEGNVLDGHNRYEILGAKTRTQVLNGCANMSPAERKAYALRVNLNRRQLSLTQRRALEREVLIPLANELRDEGKKVREVAKVMGQPKSTIQDWTGNGETNVSGAGHVCPIARPRSDLKIPKVEHPKIAARVEGGETQRSVARDYKASKQRIQQIVKSETKRQAAEAKRKAELKKAGTLDIPCPTIALASWEQWLPEQPDCDLLLTDPPYMTDVEDIGRFAESWLPEALAKVKPTGRAYVCIGAYPDELYAYLSIIPPDHLVLDQVLVWTYRNTLGPAAKDRYNLNWQAVLYYRGVKAGPLDCPSLNEQFAVQDIAAPDGRTNGRHHTWQKPDELARRFVRHATRAGDLVLDPFAGTGTFLVAAFELRRRAIGCERDPKMVKLARKRIQGP